uniref:Enoyl CoA hydratase 1, peroxisomal n=1 Tax=Neolamprologus brichardi TaxID=32507 RepID=A0A3Q4GXW6_NEOBR
MLFCFFFLDKGLRLPSQTVARAMSSSGGATPPYTTLAISRPTESITHVELHRPEKRNAMNSAFWSEMLTCFNELSEDPECRAVVVSGAGKLFTAALIYSNSLKTLPFFFSRVFADKEAMMAGALEIAGEIAGRSPVAVQGTKINLIYARNHSVADGLDYIATWNMSMLQTEDLMKSAQAALEKKSPKTKTYSKL